MHRRDAQRTTRALPCAMLSALLAMASGCAGARGEDPESVLRSYAAALDDGKIEEAYRLLSDDARRGTSLEAFRRLARDNPEEVREVARALRRPTAPPVVTATVTAPGGEELRLVLEDGRWHIDATAIDLYAQDTPRHTVQGFVRALDRKRYDVLLRYVPDAHKEGLNPEKLRAAWEGDDKDEMAQVLAALKQALPN